MKDSTIHSEMTISSTRLDIPLFAAVCIAGLVVFFQLFPLFWMRSFCFDWANHVWLTQYYDRYLVSHHQFPSTIDVIQEFGNPLPVFYSVFFYPIVALFGLIFGADIAMRIFCAILLLAPMISYAILFTRISGNCTYSILLSVVVNSTAYQITNIYFRGAITEFAAHQLLLIAISIIGCGLISNTKTKGAALLLGFACLCAGLGMHPITFYLFFALNSPILLYTAFRFWSIKSLRVRLHIAFLSALTALALTPWIFMALKYSPLLTISSNSVSRYLYYFPTSIDSLWGKIGLFFADPRVFVQGIGETSTPFLESPYSISLALVFGAFSFILFKRNRGSLIGFFIPTVITAATILYIGHTPASAENWTPGVVFVDGGKNILYDLLSRAQFAYRLSNPLSLCLTLALIFGIDGVYKNGGSIRNNPFFTVTIFIAAFISCILVCQRFSEAYIEYIKYPAQKLIYGSQRQPNDTVLLQTHQDYGRMIQNVSEYPITYYGLAAYAMTNNLASSTNSDLKNKEIIETTFSLWDTNVGVNCARSCVIYTNIVPSVFGVLSLDGEPAKDIMYSPKFTSVITADAGAHILRASKRGTLSHAVVWSTWAIIFWLLASVFYYIFRICSSRNKIDLQHT